MNPLAPAFAYVVFGTDYTGGRTYKSRKAFMQHGVPAPALAVSQSMHGYRAEADGALTLVMRIPRRPYDPTRKANPPFIVQP